MWVGAKIHNEFTCVPLYNIAVNEVLVEFIRRALFLCNLSGLQKPTSSSFIFRSIVIIEYILRNPVRVLQISSLVFYLKILDLLQIKMHLKCKVKLSMVNKM